MTNMPENSLLHHTHISSKAGWFDINLKEIWQYRDLVVMFVKKDFSLVYKQTILGPAWILLVPFLTTVIYTIVFGNIANLSTDGIPKIIFYMAGNALWSFFAECVNKTSNTFRDNANIFGKIYFPRLTKPIATVISAVVNFTAQMVMFACFWAYFITTKQVFPNWTAILALPAVLAITGGMALGCGIIVSSLTSKYRDLSIVVSYGISLWMYATPVVYPLSVAAEGWKRTMLLLNPMTPMIELFRFMLLGQGQVSAMGIAWSVAFAIAILLLGILIFNKVEKNFMDTV